MTDSETIQLREKLDNLMTAIDNVDDFVFNNVDNEDVNNVKDSWSSVWNFLDKLSRQNFKDVADLKQFAKENAE
tara:strand:+ start:299 stop:520 length:222 start_codon:yes stop_codon:yes gene_type:complete